MLDHLTDERLRQLVHDDMVCTNANERNMAAELIEARARVAALGAERQHPTQRQYMQALRDRDEAQSRAVVAEEDLSSSEQLVKQALFLCQYGERAPGHIGRPMETWAEWAFSAEYFLRRNNPEEVQS